MPGSMDRRRMMATPGTGRVLPEPLHVVDVGDVRLDEFAAGPDFIRREPGAAARFVKAVANAVGDRVRNELDHLVDGAVLAHGTWMRE